LIHPVDIPDVPGTYALLMHLEDNQRIKVGHLGEFSFLPGDYVYVGSALGSGGLRGRLGRHMRNEKKKHWHLDWFLPPAVIRGFGYETCIEQLECCWVQILMRMNGASTPVVGFGASDCAVNCAAHLIYYASGVEIEAVRARLTAHSHNRVQIISVSP
jgi:Uri superfamily endonuclease